MAKKNTTSVALRNDRIALMSLMPGADGKQMTHAAIAGEFNLTRQTISDILKSDEAMALIGMARERLREHLIESIEDGLDEMGVMAVNVIKRTLEADISAVH